MKKLLLISLLALVSGQAEAARPWYFNGGQWTCEIDGEKTKLFVRFDNAKHGDDSKATLVDYPYYQKTTFRPIHVVSINGQKVTFTLHTDKGRVGVMMFKDINGTAKGTIKLKGFQHRISCSHA